MINYNTQGRVGGFSLKSFALIVLLILLSNYFTFKRLNSTRTLPQTTTTHDEVHQPKLYLIDHAAPYVYDLQGFEHKVKAVSAALNIPPSWLMAVIHAESRFDASAVNHKGSGATGLIQWMPTTAGDFNLTVEKIRNMDHIQQLDLVYYYLDAKRSYHNTAFNSLTDVYLAILYPSALGQEYCYTLYAQPEKRYKQNSGLDEDKDGRVTIQDIDRYVKRIYPTAYMHTLAGTNLQLADEQPAVKQFFSGFFK